MIKYQQNIKRPAKKIYIFHSITDVHGSISDSALGFGVRRLLNNAISRVALLFSLCDSRKGHVYVKFFFERNMGAYKIEVSF